MLLAIGCGFLAGVVVMFPPLFATIYALMMVVVYLASGHSLCIVGDPDPIAHALSWNPIFHAVEWMRAAFYPDYNSKWLDKTYLIIFGLLCLCAGLALERILNEMLEG